MINLRKLIQIAFNYRVIKETLPNQLPNEAYYLLNDNQQKISFWNDIKLDLVGDQLTCCVEIPRQRIAKMEVIKEIKHHPIMQDTRQNIFTKQLQLRCYAQFPPFNYGFIPQTWESILTKDENNITGDNDPLDIIELGKTKHNIGDVFRAKILGSFCLIDQGQIDWKIFLLDAEQAKEQNIITLGDMDRDGKLIKQIMRWFKEIKTFDNKPENYIAYDQKIFSKEDTIELIKKTHQQWKQLHINKSKEYLDLRNEFKF